MTQILEANRQQLEAFLVGSCGYTKQEVKKLTKTDLQAHAFAVVDQPEDDWYKD